MRSKHGPLLPLTACHHRQIGTGAGSRWGAVRALCFQKPLLQNHTNGGSVAGAQLHLFKAADGALGKVAVTFLCQGLPHGALSESELDATGLEVLGKPLELNLVRGELRVRDGGQSARCGRTHSRDGGCW